MGRRDVARDVPVHRRWLHAVERDAGVPYYALQVARVIADFAAQSQDGRVHVSWSMLRRCTHQRNDRLSQSLAHLAGRGWLAEEPRKNGQRKFYRLTTPASVSGQ
jgi:hypothetical protein